ncbi:MAG: DNA-binding protein HU [Alphaproteobacteria bacterium CG11_big_fil_rev_8_21_14_0_20_44_7]|nr:MAG: DNA-binding protein HU [Alphaproteobacteria bacterium CG11_big_fil_rev_8_21_14_0_20_44_7]
MNKNELIEAIAKEAGLTKADAQKALDAAVSAITKSLKKGKEVRLVGFGTFLTQKRKATTGRNPRTGDSIKIPASTQAKFRPGKALKEAVN